MTAYVAAPWCAGARGQLAREHGRAGSVRVRAVCLADVGGDGRLDLAAVGADARRATEDSTTVGYLEPAGPATRFSGPILEAASIPSVDAPSGSIAMAQLLDAIRGADPSSLRESVGDALKAP